MCVFPKAPKIPPAVERQATQVPQDPQVQRQGSASRRRRGMWANIMTGPSGVMGKPSVTGTSATTGSTGY